MNSERATVLLGRREEAEQLRSEIKTLKRKISVMKQHWTYGTSKSVSALEAEVFEKVFQLSALIAEERARRARWARRSCLTHH